MLRKNADYSAQGGNLEKASGMEWEDMQQNYKDDIDKFQVLKTKAWMRIVEKKQPMYASFKNEQDVPQSVHDVVKKEILQWREDWGENGKEMKLLIARQQKERMHFKEKIRTQTREEMTKAREKHREQDRERER